MGVGTLIVYPRSEWVYEKRKSARSRIHKKQFQNVWGMKNHDKGWYTAFSKRLLPDSGSRHRGVAHWDYSTQGKERAVIQYMGTSKLKKNTNANGHMGMKHSNRTCMCKIRVVQWMTERQKCHAIHKDVFGEFFQKIPYRLTDSAIK